MATASATVLLLTLAAAALGDTCTPGSCAGQRRITVAKARSAAAAVADCASISAAIACIPDRMAVPGTRSGAAISAAPPRVTISVGPGRYNESVVIPAAKGKVSIIGDSPSWDDVWLMHDELCGGDDPTVRCGVVQILADDAVLANLTLHNEPYVPAGKTFTAEVAGDRAALYNVRMMGKDDAVFTGTKRVYFRDCWINGSTDFNFGQGSAVYDRCTIVAQPGQYWSFITAHAGNISTTNGTAPPPTAPRTSYLIMDSQLPYCGGGARLGTTFLGRPWGLLSSVVYLNTFMGEHIAPAGWSAGRMKDTSRLFYAEFNSTGPGANPAKRDPAISRQLTKDAAAKWTISAVFGGWVPATVPESV